MFQTTNQFYICWCPKIWGYPKKIIHFERWAFPVHKNPPASLGYPHFPSWKVHHHGTTDRFSHHDFHQLMMNYSWLSKTTYIYIHIMMILYNYIPYMYNSTYVTIIYHKITILPELQLILDISESRFAYQSWGKCQDGAVKNINRCLRSLILQHIENYSENTS